MSKLTKIYKAEIKNPIFSQTSFLRSIAPETGRWWGQIESVSEYFSEYAIYKGRVKVMTEWLKKLHQVGLLLKPNGKPITLSKKSNVFLDSIWRKFTLENAEEIWKTDLMLNHDTKASQIFLGSRLKNSELDYCQNFVDFGLTATDIDNLAFALSLKGFIKQVWIPSVKELLGRLLSVMKSGKIIMLGRTHGVPAAPTTLQKEITNVAVELKNLTEQLSNTQVSAKVAGDVGTRADLDASSKIIGHQINWKTSTEEFIRSFGLEPQEYVTQSESHANKNFIFAIFSQFSRIGEKFVSDLWMYNALGYTSWTDKLSRTGSTTMPHKINPIGTEKAETYFFLGRQLLHFVEELTMRTRMQRALVDKYALRHVGSALSYLLIAVLETTEAIDRVKWNRTFLDNEMNSHWEILSPLLLISLKLFSKIENPYAHIQTFARGVSWSKKDYLEIIKSLPIESSSSDRLASYAHENYLGEAISLTKNGIRDIEQFLKK